jgi:hypothetical protein
MALPALGCIDGGQADLMLFLGCVEHIDHIAVYHLHNAP